MAPTQTVHHHRSTTKSSHKPFKTKHASKGALKEKDKGKVERERGTRKTPHQQLMSKLDRRNQARQKQQVKHQEKVQATSVFSGANGAPRHVAIVPLSVDIDVAAILQSLNESVDVTADVSADTISRVRVDRFRQSLQYIPAKYDLLGALDACRMADFVVLALSAEVEVEEQGELLLRSIEGQGISNVVAVVQGLEKINPPKRRPQVAASLKSFMNHFFPAIEKVLSVDSRQECSNVIRSLCTATPKGIRWRDERSWMLVEETKWPEATTEVVDDVVLTGVVRGKGLKADRIVHIPGWGDFQIDSITAAPLSNARSKRDDTMNVDETEGTQVLDLPTADRDDMATVAPEEIEMEDDNMSIPEDERKGVLLDEHHYFSDDDSHLPAKPKRLPKGTSEYQSAWFIDEVSVSGSDMEDDDDEDEAMAMDTAGNPEDGVFPDHNDAMTEAGPSEYPQSEMFLDPSPEDEAQQLEEYRASRRNEASDDLEFPDEIELHPHVLARERLARFRGLKNFKTSPWETVEDRAHEPEDWRRLLQVIDYKGSKNRILREALVGGVSPGTRVDVHLRAVPSSLRNRPQPSSLFSLLRHEHKHTVVNVNMHLNASVEQPLKSKEELIVQCGPRRLVVKPVFSAGDNTPNNVHKFDRFLHPGRSAIATWIGPLTWGAVPVLVFKNKRTQDPEVLDSADDDTEDQIHPDNLELIGTGTVVAPDQSRVVAKRAILTGHPYKIHKRVVTVRYMFFNSEDINWFKALQLWTRRGRSGYIKESLGTHGYFKATFDGKLNPQDSIGISLYKRVFPRMARALEEIVA
ncbi:small subunit rRNA maturation protein TSR1 [Aspergillus clavatus NRRL 1]|uniref:Pre-rRNA processing protein Tsr1, putative n=1 Tax=Aspergillus clavatus (strain ATCC 1007 / CBS 513.65 / DSM 816 / NCTC 3887 / NRRL 1 / QM 1276 / 107) TaxID=344612 RepID=A1C6W6_ASPCL|nr:pre-rRNA processing protein Tsr1, putative [Aspergillus clavatus NRRL 1]EAW14137.1 pre-rRNA processing protein Tsr1, putative [Aspergillus clavatus NRRL 1]